MPVEVFQNQFEHDQLLAVFDSLGASRVLEIGAWQGGTLQHWLRPGNTVVVIDDEMRMADLWVEWAFKENATLHRLHGFSQEPEIIETARELGPYDFAFIDADHRYEAVKADWENFGPMASVVAFHDIIERPGYGVSRVWQEIRGEPGTRWMEINETQEHESRCGIGIVWQSSQL